MQKGTSKTTSWEKYKIKVSIVIIISFDDSLQYYFEIHNFNFGKSGLVGGWIWSFQF